MIAVADPVDVSAEGTADDSADEARAQLASCRTAIETLDLQIIALLAERLALGQQTAGLKRAVGLPILDPQREAEVIRRAVVAARAKQLPTEPVRQIFWHIVGLSRRVQEESR